MADPFSIANGVAGIVSLGLTICYGLNRYLDGIKDQGAEISSASSQLDSLQLILVNIQQCQQKLGGGNAQTAKAAVESCVGLCGDQLKALNGILNRLERNDSSPNHAKSKWRELKSSIVYPFR